MYGFLLLSSTLLIHRLQTASLPGLSSKTQFGVVLDAGSSSTKIRIYSWTKIPDTVPVLEEVFYSKSTPGISAFHENIKDISDYLLHILNTIEENVPEQYWYSTPVFFKATAGMA